MNLLYQFAARAPTIMASWDDYELLDFGRGRKLERFGPCLLDRPSPAAESAGMCHPGLWAKATARYQRTVGEQGEWTGRLPSHWICRGDAFQLQLKPTPFGHIGMFPEQIANWQWLARRLTQARWSATADQRPRVLNLFAYTGGSTLAAAAAGAEVVHVDAAKNVVAWARRNAELSQLQEAPIRWLVEDARRFVQRELRRGRQYEAIILDPPSYGHGPSQGLWKMDDDLPLLLADCERLLSDRRCLMLFTCHSPNWTPAVVQRQLNDALLSVNLAGTEVTRLQIPATDGRALDAGVVARVEFRSS